MKFLAFLLSVYILALNLAPCDDNVTHDNMDKTEILQAIGDNHQHQDSDFCSPFCICQCCHVNVIYSHFTYVKLDINIISTQDFFDLKGEEKDFATSIIQPPRA